MLGDVIGRLSREFIEAATNEDMRDAAQKTGGVPVYADVGGVLVVSSHGVVVHYDPETTTVSPVQDERWRTLALARAAKKYEGLAELMPARPVSAVACPHCGGRGQILDGLECGSCMGLGWVAS